jgi:hypothetical protein
MLNLKKYWFALVKNRLLDERLHTATYDVNNPPKNNPQFDLGYGRN